MLGAGSCSTTTACAADSSGVYVCDGYAGAYPYDYAYVDPLYAGPGGYYPYTVDTYYDPLGYDTLIYNPLAAGPTPVADPTNGSDVPELLGKAQRAANAVNAGVRAALDPIKELITTAPRVDGDAVVYGPARHRAADYQFTMRLLSESERRFGWKLEARPANSSGSFTQVAGGLIRVGDVPRRGRGAVGVDCGAMAAADSAVTCRGMSLIGFAHTVDGDKILNVAASRLHARREDDDAARRGGVRVAERRRRQQGAAGRAHQHVGDGVDGAGDRRHQAGLAQGRRGARRRGRDRR